MVYFLYKEFEKLGYSISTSLTALFYSVPQRRERFIMFGALSSNPIAIPKPTSALNLVTLRDAIGSIQKGQHDFIKLKRKSFKIYKTS